jgi:CBS domain-containing protein
MVSEASAAVGDVMSSPIETISRNATVSEAATKMRDLDISGLFVTGSQPGIVTTTDVVDVVAAGNDPKTETVSDVMTAPVERVTTTIEIAEAAAMMTNFGIKHLPVTDNQGDYVGMLSSSDITAELA